MTLGHSHVLACNVGKYENRGDSLSFFVWFSCCAALIDCFPFGHPPDSFPTQCASLRARGGYCACVWGAYLSPTFVHPFGHPPDSFPTQCASLRARGGYCACVWGAYLGPVGTLLLFPALPFPLGRPLGTHALIWSWPHPGFCIISTFYCSRANLLSFRPSDWLGPQVTI